MLHSKSVLHMKVVLHVPVETKTPYIFQKTAGSTPPPSFPLENFLIGASAFVGAKSASRDSPRPVTGTLTLRGSHL